MAVETRSQLLARYGAAEEPGTGFDDGLLESVATALADQFAALYDARPRHCRSQLGGHVLTFSFLGGLSRFDELLLEGRRDAEVRDFRVLFLEAVSPQLGEVVEALSGFGVSHFFASFDPVRQTTECLFLLDPRRSDEDEQRRALLNWSEQVRRNARELRERHREAREAHARQRELMRKAREGLDG